MRDPRGFSINPLSKKMHSTGPEPAGEKITVVKLDRNWQNSKTVKFDLQT